MLSSRPCRRRCRRRTKRRYLELFVLVTVALTVAWVPSTLQALDIVLVEPGADAEFGTRHMDIPQWLAVEEAARMWERAFGDDITVTIAGNARSETTSPSPSPFGCAKPPVG
jgi:hypothetical protein